MFEDEPRNKIPFLAILGAVFFGAGSVWAGSQGLRVAFSHLPVNSNTQKASIIDVMKIASSTTPIVSDISSSTIDETLDVASRILRSTISSIELPSASTTILIGGDLMLDRRIRWIGEKNGYDYLFTSLSPLFKSADIVITNLEGPITSNPSKTLLPSGATTKGLAFTFSPKTADAISKAGITAVSLANNHTYNFGAAGVAETTRWLKKSSVGSFGNPWNASSTELVIEKNGMKIAFVGYHAFEPGIARVISTVQKLSAQGDFVIVMPHWGEEYSSAPSDKMREQARTMIGAGAKAIIGSHPHVMMSNETIAGVPVYYSLGNLLFDQYFSPEVMKGEIISLKLVSGPSGPAIGEVRTYGVQLDKNKGVVLK